MTYVLDTSAVLRFLDGTAGGKRVDDIIGEHIASSAFIQMAALHWGELAGVLVRRSGLFRMQQLLADLESFGFELVPATAARSVAAALLRHQTGLSYVDAHGAELARTPAGKLFVTADYDSKAAEEVVSVEFLPSNPADEPLQHPNHP